MRIQSEASTLSWLHFSRWFYVRSFFFPVFFALLLLILMLQPIHSMIISMSTASKTTTATSRRTLSRIIRIPESLWRKAASDHHHKIKELLEEPGFILPRDQFLNSSGRKQKKEEKLPERGWFGALDPKHPVCNFLIEYYGLKGVKGIKRLARWNPSPNLLLQEQDYYSNLQEFQEASNRYFLSKQQQQYKCSGILLEGVKEDDMAWLLHLKGAIWDEDSKGALYSPSLWYEQRINNKEGNNNNPAGSFLWNRAIIQQTLQAEPVLHCHGLHEWAMQYKPAGQPDPPSAKYQAHLPLRVSRQIINDTVERKGVSCTHVDALRFFAPAAGPLNHYGFPLKRQDQPRLEQPACVHAQMDLLKMTLRLQPFCNPILLQQVLELSLDSRRLDVGASPYDATAYGVEVIPVETEEGRSQYRKQQRVLMERAEPIREYLLDSYNTFLQTAFGEEPTLLNDLGGNRESTELAKAGN